MPCGCGCCGDGFVFGHLMYMLEKIAAFCAMSAIISCIIVTVIVSIGVGVGIGYNYCFVDLKTSKLTALENFKNSDNPPKLPGKKNVSPFSGESANEKEVTTQNTNTFILQTSPLRMPTLQFPNVPNIAKISDDDLIKMDQEFIVTNAPNVVKSITTSEIIPVGFKRTLGSPKGSDDSKFSSETTSSTLNIPKVDNVETSDIPIDSNYISDTQSNAGESESAVVKANSTPDDSESTSDTSDVPGDSDSFPDTHDISTDFKPNSSLIEYASFGNDSNSADGDISGGQESLTNQVSNQNLQTKGQFIPNIPQSPNFPGSFRRIPTNYRKNRPTASKQRPATNWRRNEFEEIREGIKENAKKIDKSFGTYKRVNKAEKANFRRTEKADNNRRRVSVQRKKQNKVTTTTTYMPTIVIPLKKYANMSPLISRILAQNKNVTLQFITL